MTTLTEQAAAKYAENKHTGFFGVSALCQHHEVPISKDAFTAGHQHCETHLLPEFLKWLYTTETLDGFGICPDGSFAAETNDEQLNFEQLLAKFKAEKNY